MCFLCLFVATNLRAEAAAVFGGEDEAEDHVPEVARIVRQRCDPVGVANRIRVAAQVSEVLHRYKRTDEKLVLDRFALNDLAQDLPARLLIRIKRRNQICLVTERDLRILLERVYI